MQYVRHQKLRIFLNVRHYTLRNTIYAHITVMKINLKYVKELSVKGKTIKYSNSKRITEDNPYDHLDVVPMMGQ